MKFNSINDGGPYYIEISTSISRANHLSILVENYI